MAHPPQHIPAGEKREDTEPSEQTATRWKGAADRTKGQHKKMERLLLPITPTPHVSLCPEECVLTTHMIYPLKSCKV